ncbi:MAG: FAD-dependent oxidoreductase [Candidatus Jorgensenbacteria bacterium]
MKNIVILGGGFGGLACALRVGKALKRLKLSDRYEVVVVDRNPYHTFTPLLYEIAATAEAAATNAVLQSIMTMNLRELLAGLPITVVEDSVISINLAERTVRLTKNGLSFEYLVIALGAEVNYFGIQGLGEYTLPLKTFADAIKIRNALTAAVARAGENPVRVVVGGGGPTGVELAGEIANNYRGKHLHVTIVEAGSSILAKMNPRVIRRTERRLKRLGVSILTRERITKVFPTFVLLESGEKVYFDVCIWTGGVKPSSLAEPLLLKKEPRGRLEVAPDLAAAEHVCPVRDRPADPLRLVEDEARGMATPAPGRPVSNGVFAIGDIAYLHDPRTKAPVPGGMARPAMMEGRIAAANIIENIKADESRIYADKNNGVGRHSKKYEYTPRRYPYIVPVGGKYAIAKIGPFVISGFPAWIFKGVVELNYFLSIMLVWKALRIWLKGLMVFIKNNRLG